MCGIVALISPAMPISESLLTAMRDRLMHRGPDSGRNWLALGGRVGLAHRRLSIIDISHGADQPMASADGRFHLVFNGEIYNYIELRLELENLGATFHTRSDTEVLLVALQEWGVDTLTRLNGMFAFALWDSVSSRMLIARDRFGEKPLFIGRGKFGLVGFASEMKALLNHPLIDAGTSEKAIARYAAGGWYEDDEQTFFENIKRFPPAHAAWFHKDGSEDRRWRYWTPNYTDIDTEIGAKDAVERFTELMQRSIHLRLRADVPVGSSLSGGLDSSLIVGLLTRERSVQEFTQNTFSACFPSDPTMSEEREIDAVVTYAGVNSYIVEPHPEQLIRESALLHWHQEEPFLSASIYLQWCVARLAQQQNTKVLLDGQGADELLAGYQFYFRPFQLDLLDLGHSELAKRETAKFNRRLRSASQQYKDSARRFNASVAYSDSEIASMASGWKRPPVTNYPYTEGVAPTIPGSRLRRTLSEALLYNSLPMLLRYADRNSMAFSRESRLPYLDYDLVDFCIRIPDEYYIRNGWQKWILRQAAANCIPAQIRWRADKVGYAAPLDLWLRKELFSWGYERVTDSRLKDVPGFSRAMIDALWHEHQSEGINNSWALWKWISLAEWMEIRDMGWWRAKNATTNIF